MKDFKYPIPVASCRYVTEFGGRSKTLARGKVGLHIEALRQNTELSHDDRVLLDVVGEEGEEPASPPTPLFMKSTFKIEPLRGVRGSHLLSMSSEGEAVLPYTIGEDLEIGDEIILNSAVDRIPEGWIVKQIHGQMGD
ncbi:hypothetical protein AKJ38_03790 [candidate division MSBL1 archaeon SCGC-AAA259I14]|uniref:Uncharacterized protein n=1 Tax=candidate division MSBL1 archaeon SCGC-AAA259I14 TaxID=1698268 RepID=A0A133UPS6_9EURY|nr:hypothetical protein AKJ38_03790 [candidate division MSBL1 archaeon SCGC-AAA259I14]